MRATGRTFRPGPRVEYKQPRRRFTDSTLSTVEIVSPLDVAYGPGGTRWRQTNGGRMASNRTFRPGPRAEYKQPARRFTDDTLSTTDIDTPLDVAYAPGGTRWRQTVPNRRPASEAAYCQRRTFNIVGGIPDVTGTIAATQDDDVAAITVTFIDPPYGDGGIRARVQQAAYRRPAAEGYYQRRFPFPPPETYTAVISAAQDDDQASITATFIDPAYGDGGARARAQSSVYRRLASRIPFTRRFLIPPAETYTATIAVTQDDDVAALVGQADLPYTGDSPTRARAQSSVFRRLASRIPFTRHFLTLPQDTTVVGSITVTQDDDVAAIAGTFTDPPYLGDGGIRARVQAAAYRRPGSEIYYQRHTFPAATIAPVTGTIAATQDDDTAAITGQVDAPYTGDGGIRSRHLSAQGHRPRALYCQRRYTDFAGTDPSLTLPPLIPPFAAFINAYSSYTANPVRSVTRTTITTTSTSSTTPRTSTVSTTPEGVT